MTAMQWEQIGTGMYQYGGFRIAALVNGPFSGMYALYTVYDENLILTRSTREQCEAEAERLIRDEWDTYECCVPGKH